MECRLAAILAADAVGDTRVMGEDAMRTIQRLPALREAVPEPLVAEHPGRVVKLAGDGCWWSFPTCVDAVTRAR